MLDETEDNKRRQQKQEVFRRYKQWRDEVEKRRDADRQMRNIAKERQIQMAEEWQAALDKVREDINTAREAYRQTFIVQVTHRIYCKFYCKEYLKVWPPPLRLCN